MIQERTAESRFTELEEEDKEHFSRLEPIVYGSKITISLADHPNFILHSPGFIQENILIHNIDGALTDSLSQLANDPSNCIFELLPFTSLRNFQFQSKLHGKMRDFNQLQQEIFPNETSKYRSDRLETIKKKLWEEVGSNKNSIEKVRGSHVLYENSVFVLLHSDSLKFLTLNTEDSEKSQ